VIDLRKQRGVYEPLALLAAEQRRTNIANTSEALVSVNLPSLVGRVRHTNVGNNYQVDLSAALGALSLSLYDDSDVVPFMCSLQPGSSTQVTMTALATSCGIRLPSLPRKVAQCILSRDV